MDADLLAQLKRVADGLEALLEIQLKAGTEKIERDAAYEEYAKLRDAVSSAERTYLNGTIANATLQRAALDRARQALDDYKASHPDFEDY